MGWCERCGAFFVIGSGRSVTKTIGARGRGQGIFDIIDTVCPSCLHLDEEYDENGVVISKSLADEMRSAYVPNDDS